MDAIFASLSKGANFKKRKAHVLESKNKSTISEKEESGDINTDLRSEDDINGFRNRLQIRVKGSDVPSPAPSFSDMNICPDLKHVILRNVETSDWKEPTAIQMQAIPVMLQNRDILASAPTGSGKTASFVIPILSKLGGPMKVGIRALVLAPTRELAEQIHREASRLCAGRRIQIGIIRKNAQTSSALEGHTKGAYSKYDMLVSTPMRIVALLRASAIDLSAVETVVLDEADKLFEIESGGGSAEEEDETAGMSSSAFLSQVDEILSQCTYESNAAASRNSSTSDGNGGSATEGKKKKKTKKEKEEPVRVLQRGLFSATIGPLVQELADTFLRNPVHVSIGRDNTGASSIKQKLMFVGREDGKLFAIRRLVTEGALRPPVLLFLQSKERAKELHQELAYDGINVDVMHSDRSQAQREALISRFRTGDIWVLICTDLMARGIDFKAVKMVINYDLPQSSVAYIHRIGRTGRAGREGEAITFFTEADIPQMRSIANVMKLSGCDVPEWLLSVKQLTTKEKKKLRRSAPERPSISKPIAYDLKIKNKRKLMKDHSKKKKQQQQNAES